MIIILIGRLKQILIVSEIYLKQLRQASDLECQSKCGLYITVCNVDPQAVKDE